MAERISVHHKKFEDDTNNIRNACRSITLTAKGVPTSNSCRKIMLLNYVNKVQSIARLMTSYQALLLKDIDDIDKSVRTIEQADRDAENVWKVITKNGS